MNAQEFLKLTYSETNNGFPNIRARLICKDGFSVSVQASAYHYCNPKENGIDIEYTEVELGYPEFKNKLHEFLINLNKFFTKKFIHCRIEFERGISGCVPIEKVNKLIKYHGGINESKYDFNKQLLLVDQQNYVIGELL